MEFFKALMNPAGGLSYHYLALKYQSVLWRRFREQLNWLLCDWKHFQNEIILVGPSGGYCLSRDFLEKFETIHVYDPDPMAQWVFQKRFPQLPVQWNLESPFFRADSSPAKALWKLKSDHPQAALLFCNVLGQWPLIENVSEEMMDEFADNLSSVYSQSNWASFHDLFSGPSRWKTWPSGLQRKEVDFQTMEDVKQFWAQTGGQNLTDHLTFKKLKSAKRKKHLIWPLTPKQVHIIEWVQG